MLVVFQGRDSGNHKVADQAIAMERYCPFIHGGKDFRSSYITFDIFNNWTFFGTVEKTNEK